MREGIDGMDLIEPVGEDKGNNETVNTSKTLNTRDMGLGTLQACLVGGLDD